MTASRISVLVVDDESLARRGLVARLKQHSDVDIVGESQNGNEAVEAIAVHTPDVVFLDIQMPGLNGFQVIQKCRERQIELPLIVFVTAYDAYAVKAFEVHALDYVLKPADDERLSEVMDKVRQYLSVSHHREQTRKLVGLLASVTGEDVEHVLESLANGELFDQVKYPDVIAIKDGTEVSRVTVKDIQWVDAAGDYMCVHTSSGTHIMRKTMKELELELNPHLFVRVHRSAIVNIHYVKKLVSHVSGEYHLILDNNTELKVSRSHRDKVKAAMGLS